MPLSSIDPGIPGNAAGPVTGPVIACIDGTSRAAEVAAAAAEFAGRLGRRLILFHVVEHPGFEANPPDPLDWVLRKQEGLRALTHLRERLSRQIDDVALVIDEGVWPAALQERSEAGAVLVVGMPRRTEFARSAAHAVGALADACAASSVLLVPPGYTPSQGGRQGRHRIAVPIDGSNFAEAALAEAARLARRFASDLLLIHVVPDAGLTDFGLPAIADLDLRTMIDRRNEEAACSFLDQTRRRLLDQGLTVRSHCLNGEPRTTLLRALDEDAPDLVVLSARGHGGRRCQDLALGSTASYLVDHVSGPILLVPSAGHLPARAHSRGWAPERGDWPTAPHTGPQSGSLHAA